MAAARIALLCAVVAAVLSGGGAPPAADELIPNRTYAAGTAVEARTMGVAFVLPQGWVGKFAQDKSHQVVVMGSNTLEGVGLAILQAGQSATQVAATLGEPQDLGDGVVLRPTAPPDTQGSRITARFQNTVYVGRALAVLGPTGNSVIFFFAGPLKNEAAYGQILEGLARTTGFAAAVPAPPRSHGRRPRATWISNGQDYWRGRCCTTSLDMTPAPGEAAWRPTGSCTSARTGASPSPATAR